MLAPHFYQTKEAKVNLVCDVEYNIALKAFNKSYFRVAKTDKKATSNCIYASTFKCQKDYFNCLKKDDKNIP